MVEGIIASILADIRSAVIAENTMEHVAFSEENTKYYVRGIRDGKDMEYEEKSFEFSVKLFPEMETLFVNCSKETKGVSSTLVKQLIKDGKPFGKYVPREALPIITDFIK